MYYVQPFSFSYSLFIPDTSIPEYKKFIIRWKEEWNEQTMKNDYWIRLGVYRDFHALAVSMIATHFTISHKNWYNLYM